MGPLNDAMRRIQSQVTYTVPGWNFCNNDNLLPGGRLQKDVCRFCIKTKSGHRCMLYDQPLKTDGEFIDKIKDCCRATAGFASNIEEAPPTPTVDPRELIKQTIDVYNKNVKVLIRQHYPREIAEQLAKQIMLGR